MYRIGLVCRIAWPVKGGLTWHALRLGQEIKKHGFDLEIITRFTKRDIQGNDYFWQNEESRTFNNEGVRTHVIGLSNIERVILWPVSRLRTRKHLRPLAREIVKYSLGIKFKKLLQHYDIVHYDGGGWELMSYAALRASRKLKKKFIVQPSIHIGQWGCEKIDHDLFKRADAMFVHSNIEKQYLVEEVGILEKKIYVVGNGIDDVRGGNGYNFKKQNRINGIMNLFIGRRSHDKGYYLVHEAFEEISKRHPETWMVIIGPLQNGKKQYIPNQNHPGKERIIELDYVDDQTRKDAYDACDIFVQPSIGESFGLVFVEAALCGKPVMGRKLDILEELLGQYNAAVLIGKKNKNGIVKLEKEELVKAWEELLNKQYLRIEIGERARLAAEKHLWKSVIYNFKNAYIDVIGNA